MREGLDQHAGASEAHRLRSLLGRAAAFGAAGAVVTASTFLGAGTASAAGSAVIEQCSGTADSTEYGQPILASPAALDAKVEQAALTVFPLRFDLAAQAKEEFTATGSIELGSVTAEDQSFSGTTLAEAFTPQIEGLAALEGKGAEVAQHVRNLAALGCWGGAKVPGQEQPAPPPAPPEPSPTEQPAPPPAPEPSAPAGGDVPAPAEPSAPSSAYAAPAPVAVVPPSYAAGAPGALPPWAQTRFGTAPGFSPDVGDLLAQSEQQRKQQEEQQRQQAAQEEVRAAGRAETLPAGQGDRVALPVLIAAISLAGVTAALVRTWVLRRS